MCLSLSVFLSLFLSLGVCLCLYFSHSVFLSASVCLSVYSTASLFLFLCVCLSLSLYLLGYLFLYLSFYLSLCVSLCICLPPCPYKCVSMPLFASGSMGLSLCLSTVRVCVCFSISGYVRLSFSLSPYHRLYL